MPFFIFQWTPDAERHIGEHGITAEEFQEVVMQPRQTGISRSSGMPIAIGETSAGKTLVCVYEVLDETTVLPVTAYERG